MAEKHGIVVGLDAASVDRGLSQMDRRLNQTLGTLDRFDKRAGQVFSRLDQASGKIDISRLTAQINGLTRTAGGIDRLAASTDKLTGAVTRLAATSGTLSKVSRDFTALAGSVQKVSTAARTVGTAAASIEKLTAAVGGKRINTRGMERMAETIRAMSGIRLDPRIVPQLSVLSNAMAGFKAPSRAAVQNTQGFFNALKTAVDPNTVRTLSGLSTAAGGFRGPGAAAVTQLQRLVATASGASVAQINSLASAITKLSAANASMIGSGPAAAAMMRATQRTAQNPATAAVTAQRAQPAQRNQQFRRPSGAFAGTSNSEMMLYGPLGGFSQMSGGATGLLGMATLAGSATKIMEEYNRTIATTALLTNELGDKPAAIGQFERLRKVANETGQSFANLADTTPSLTIAMRANGATLAETNEVILGVSTAMTALGRNPQQVERAMRAIEQSFSKGRVGMEELRQQLGDALPGAFGVFAKAANMTEAELSMKIGRNEFIDPKVFIEMGRILQRQFGPALAEQMNTSQRQMTILGNAFGKLMSDIGAAGADRGIADMMKQVTAAVNGISAERIQAIGQVLGTVFRGIGHAAAFLVSNIEAVAIAAGAISFAAMIAAGSALLGMFTGMVGMVTRAVTGLAAFSVALGATTASNTALTASAAAATTALNAQAAAQARVVHGSASAAVAQTAQGLASAGTAAAATASIWQRLGGAFLWISRAALGFLKLTGLIAVGLAAIGVAFPSVAEGIDTIIPGFSRFADIVRTVFSDGISYVRMFTDPMMSAIGGAISWSTTQFQSFFGWLGGRFSWMGRTVRDALPGQVSDTDISTLGSIRRLAGTMQGYAGGYAASVNQRVENASIERQINAASSSPLGANTQVFGAGGIQAAQTIANERFAQQEEERRRNRIPTGAEVLQRQGQTANQILELDPIRKARQEYQKLAETLEELAKVAVANPNDTTVVMLGGAEGIARTRARLEESKRAEVDPVGAMIDEDTKRLRLLAMTAEARQLEEEVQKRINELTKAGVANEINRATIVAQVTALMNAQKVSDFMNSEWIALDPLRQANKELEEFLKKLNLARDAGRLTGDQAAEAEALYRARNRERLDPVGARVDALAEQTRGQVRESRLRGLAGGERAFQIALEKEMDAIAKARFGTSNTDALTQNQQRELEEARKRLEPALRQNMASAGGALYQSRVADMREELRLAGLTTEQRQLEMQVLRQVREIEAATGRALDPAQIAELRGLVQAIDTMNKGGSTGIQQWVNGTKSLRDALNDVEKNGINSLSDALTDLVTDGTADFQKLGKSLLREINRAIIQSMLADLFRSTGFMGGFSLAGLFGVGAGTSGQAPSMFGGMFGGAAQPAPAVAAQGAPQAAASGFSIFTPFGAQGLLGGALSRGGQSGGAGIFGAFGNVVRPQVPQASTVMQQALPNITPSTTLPRAPQITPPSATTGPTMQAPIPQARPQDFSGAIPGAQLMQAPLPQARPVPPLAANDNAGDMMNQMMAQQQRLTSFNAPVPTPRPQIPPPQVLQQPLSGAALQARDMANRPTEFMQQIYQRSRALGMNDVQARMTAAQAAHESAVGRASGMSQLATRGNNLFGVKAGRGWQGETLNMRTREVVNGQNVMQDATWRKYGSVDDALRDRMQFMQRRYPQSWNARTTDEAISGLRTGQQGGYATEPEHIYRAGMNHRLARLGNPTYNPATTTPQSAPPAMPGNQMDAMGAAQQQVSEQYRQQMSQAVTQNAQQLSSAGTQTAQQMQTSMQQAVQQTAQQIPQQVTPAVTGAITPGVQGVGDIMQSTAQAQMGQGGFWQNIMGSGGFGGGGGFLSMLFGGFKTGGYSDGPAPQTYRASPAAFRNAPHFDKGTARVGGRMGGTPAILHPNEAVIPLTGGRKVPVELGNDNQANDNRGGGTTIIMNVQAKDADSFKRSEKQIRARQSAALHRANQYNN